MDVLPSLLDNATFVNVGFRSPVQGSVGHAMECGSFQKKRCRLNFDIRAISGMWAEQEQVGGIEEHRALRELQMVEERLGSVYDAV